MKISVLLISFWVALSALGQSQISTVTNLNALTNRPPSAVNPVVMTQGRVSSGDGKGGIYIWTPGSSATIDNTNVLGSASLPSGGRWLLSLPSVTPLASDGSKVDRTNGVATGLSVSGPVLTGTVTVNGVNLETKLTSIDSAVATKLGHTGGYATNLSLYGSTSVAGPISLTDSANFGKLTIYGPSGQLTNNGVTAAAIAGFLATDAYSPSAYGAVADGVTDDTTSLNNCAIACAAAGVPMQLKGLIYGVGFFKAPAGLRLRGGGGTLKALSFPSGVGSTNTGVIHVTGDNVDIQDLKIDQNRAGLISLRVPVDSTGGTGGSTDYVFTRLLHGIIAESRSGLVLRNIVFTNGINEPLYIHACTSPRIANIRSVDQMTGPKILNCTDPMVDNMETADSLFNLQRCDPFGIHIAFNYGGEFRSLKVNNIGGTTLGGSSFLSGINNWGNVGSRFIGMEAGPIHPSNTLTSTDGILFDGIYNVTIDGGMVRGGWSTPAVEVMGAENVSINNLVIDCTGVSGETYGITFKNEANMKGPGPGFPNYRSTLQRGRSQGGNVVVRNLRVLNAKHGAWINAPNITFDSCVFLGGAYAGIEIDDDDGNSGAAGIFQQRIPIALHDVSLVNCVVRGYDYWGVRLYGGKRIRILGGNFSDNGQAGPSTGSGIYGLARYVVTPSAGGAPYANNVTVGSTSPSALSSNNKLDYRRVDVFDSGGAFVQSRQIVANNGTTQITVSTNFSPSVAATDKLYIGPWDQGDVEVVGVSANDTQSWEESRTVSFSPLTCTTLATLTNLTFTRGTQELFPGQRLKLWGVATGGADTNVIVKVKGWTEPFADQVEVEPLTLGTGAAFGSATLVVPTVALSGVWTSTATGNWTGSRKAGDLGVLTPGAGAATSELDGFFYLINAGAWTGTQDAARIYQFNGSTDVKLTDPFSPAITSGTVAKVAILKVSAIPSQSYGVRLDNWNGATAINGISSSGNITASTLITTAPNTTIGTW